MCISLLLTVNFAYGQQTVESLEQEIIKAQKEIEKSQKLLALTHDKQKDGITQLQLTQSNISNRKKIISNLDKQLKITTNSISGNNSTIKQLTKELAALKVDYTKSIVNRYKDIKQSNYLVFLFSSNSFYEMQLRSKYLEKVTGFTKVKSQSISSKSSEISDKNRSLEQKNREIEQLRSSREKELETLTQEEEDYKNLLASLEKEEATLNADIINQSKQISQLQNEIQKLIEELNKKNDIVDEPTKQELAEQSLKFAENKGKLSPPIQGVITSHFGLQSDPIQKNIKVKNNGINITASEVNVKSVFAGEVVKVFFFQGLNNSVMIRHGSYLSVYSNMSEVYIEMGDMVKTSQKIGKIATGGNNQSVHFELWEETTPLNPTEWIKF